jgi:hypothetical protein
VLVNWHVRHKKECVAAPQGSRSWR